MLWGRMEFLLSSVGIFFRIQNENLRLHQVKVLLGLFTCFEKNGKQATKCNPAFNTGKSSAEILTR